MKSGIFSLKSYLTVATWHQMMHRDCFTLLTLHSQKMCVSESRIGYCAFHLPCPHSPTLSCIISAFKSALTCKACALFMCKKKRPKKLNVKLKYCPPPNQERTDSLWVTRSQRPFELVHLFSVAFKGLPVQPIIMFTVFDHFYCTVLMLYIGPSCISQLP